MVFYGHPTRFAPGVEDADHPGRSRSSARTVRRPAKAVITQTWVTPSTRGVFTLDLCQQSFTACRWYIPNSGRFPT